MGRPNKIRSAGFEAKVRKLAAEGLTYRQISDKVAELGLEVSHVAVGRFLTEEADERRGAARNVAASEAQQSVPLVTSKLRKWVETVDALVDQAMADSEADDGQDGESGPHASPAEQIARRARRASSRSEDVARLVNAGTKAAKALHDITVGDGPSDPMSALRDEAIEILAQKRKREAVEE
jgi:hypothetical protein